MKRTHRLIALMIGFHFIGGWLSPFLFAAEEIPQASSALMMIPLAMLLYMWCKADIAERKIEQPEGATLLVGLFSLVGVPYYFYRSRPWRTATASTFFAVIVFVILQAAFEAGVYLGQAA